MIWSVSTVVVDAPVRVHIHFISKLPYQRTLSTLVMTMYQNILIRATLIDLDWWLRMNFFFSLLVGHFYQLYIFFCIKSSNSTSNFAELLLYQKKKKIKQFRRKTSSDQKFHQQSLFFECLSSTAVSGA